MPLRFKVLPAVMTALFRRQVASYHLNLVQMPQAHEEQP